MSKKLLEELKTVTTWEEANAWLSIRGWGLGLIEEQKVLWDEFKKSGKDSAELIFDTVAGVIAIVAAVEPEVVVEPQQATTKPGK